MNPEQDLKKEKDSITFYNSNYAQLLGINNWGTSKREITAYPLQVFCFRENEPFTTIVYCLVCCKMSQRIVREVADSQFSTCQC